MFDNDGTLWCEKPMPIQLDFILRRLVEMAEARPGAARAPAVEGRRTSATTPGSARVHGRALRRRRHQRAGRWPAASWPPTPDQRRRLRGAGRRVPAQRAAPDARSRLPRVRLRPDGRAARATWRRTASRTTSSRAAVATSCARSAQEVYGIPRERVIGSATALAYASDERGGTITHKAEADYLDDGAAEADPHLEPHRPPAAARRRQLQRRHRDARLHPAPGQAVPAPARPARRRRARVRLHHRRRAGARAGRRATAGRSSASRTTGRRSSEGRTLRATAGPVRERALLGRLQRGRARAGAVVGRRDPLLDARRQLLPVLEARPQQSWHARSAFEWLGERHAPSVAPRNRSAYPPSAAFASAMTRRTSAIDARTPASATIPPAPTASRAIGMWRQAGTITDALM